MQLIPRKEYLEKLNVFKDKQLIKVITGLRRCGKSTLMQMFQDELLSHGVKETQLIAINFEDLKFSLHL